MEFWAWEMSGVRECYCKLGNSRSVSGRASCGSVEKESMGDTRLIAVGTEMAPPPQMFLW